MQILESAIYIVMERRRVLAMAMAMAMECGRGCKQRPLQRRLGTHNGRRSDGTRDLAIVGWIDARVRESVYQLDTVAHEFPHEFLRILSYSLRGRALDSPARTLPLIRNLNC